MPRIKREFVENRFKEFCEVMGYDEGTFELDYFHGYRIIKKSKYDSSAFPAFVYNRFNAETFTEMLEFAIRCVEADRERIRLERDYD